MKNRTTLVLMEQLLMILVFALAAALCLRLFVGADQISQTTQRTDRAVVLAQNGAETAKATKGDLSAMAQTLGGKTETGAVVVEKEDLRMKICLLPEEITGLGQAQVQVLDARTGEEVYCLSVGWQEEVGR